MLWDVLAQHLIVLWENESCEVKTMNSWILLYKILFDIKRSKNELDHTNLGSVRMLWDALGCSSSTFDWFMAKLIL